MECQKCCERTVRVLSTRACQCFFFWIKMKKIFVDANMMWGELCVSWSQIGGEKENVQALGIFGNGQLFVVVGGGGGGGGASLVCAVLSPGRSVALAFTALLLHLSPHTAAAAAARPPTAARPENEPSRVQPVRAQPVRRCWKRATELRASQSCQGRVTGHHLAPRPDQTRPTPNPCPRKQPALASSLRLTN